MDFGSGSLSRDSDGNAKKQSSSLCHMKLSEPTTEDAASLDILGMNSPNCTCTEVEHLK